MTWIASALAGLSMIGLTACDVEEPGHPVTLDDGRVVEFVAAADTLNWADDSHFTELLVRWPDWEDNGWETIRTVMPETCTRIVAHLRATDPSLEIRPVILMSVAGSESYVVVSFNKRQTQQFRLDGDACVDPVDQKEG